MGTGGRPGKFPAMIVNVKSDTVTFKAAPEDIVYLKSQVGREGTVDWNPNSPKPDVGNLGKSAS